MPSNEFLNVCGACPLRKGRAKADANLDCLLKTCFCLRRLQAFYKSDRRLLGRRQRGTSPWSSQSTVLPC